MPKKKHADDMNLSCWVPKEVGRRLDEHLAAKCGGDPGVRTNRQGWLRAKVERALDAELAGGQQEAPLVQPPEAAPPQQDADDLLRELWRLVPPTGFYKDYEAWRADLARAVAALRDGREVVPLAEGDTDDPPPVHEQLDELIGYIPIPTRPKKPKRKKAPADQPAEAE